MTHLIFLKWKKKLESSFKNYILHWSWSYQLWNKIHEALQDHTRRPGDKKNSLEKEQVQLQPLPLLHWEILIWIIKFCQWYQEVKAATFQGEITPVDLVFSWPLGWPVQEPFFLYCEWIRCEKSEWEEPPLHYQSNQTTRWCKRRLQKWNKLFKRCKK